jgi:aspartokinase/homoserine dehydrogenase 1
VARKILILARLTGRRLELSDVKISRFLPDDAFDMEQEEFLNNLARFHAAFESGEEGVWRFVATLDQHHVHVGLKRLPRTHPFAALQGSDNQIRFYTRRYAEAPLVIQGSGAGAERTASGVFSDILRLVAFQFMP